MKKFAFAVICTFAVLGSMAVEGPVISWVANHRKHHAYADQPGRNFEHCRRVALLITECGGPRERAHLAPCFTHGFDFERREIDISRAQVFGRDDYDIAAVREGGPDRERVQAFPEAVPVPGGQWPLDSGQGVAGHCKR